MPTPRTRSRGLAAIVALCRIGRAELLDRFERGELKIGELWTAAKGAVKCSSEIALGGAAALVDPVVAAARIERGCEMCPSRTMGALSRITDPDGEATMVRSWYCGPALEEHGRPVGEGTEGSRDRGIKSGEGRQRESIAPTCGCLLATETVRAEGEGVVRLNVLPACAALLKSKQCWQGKW